MESNIKSLLCNLNILNILQELYLNQSWSMRFKIIIVTDINYKLVNALALHYFVCIENKGYLKTIFFMQLGHQ